MSGGPEASPTDTAGGRPDYEATSTSLERHSMHWARSGRFADSKVWSHSVHRYSVRSTPFSSAPRSRLMVSAIAMAVAAYDAAGQNGP